MQNWGSTESFADEQGGGCPTWHELGAKCTRTELQFENEHSVLSHPVYQTYIYNSLDLWRSTSSLLHVFTALYFLIQKIFPKTLIYSHCLAEGIIPACFVPKAELISNVCPGVSAEPLWLNRKSELANSTGHQGSCTPLLQAKEKKSVTLFKFFPFEHALMKSRTLRLSCLTNGRNLIRALFLFNKKAATCLEPPACPSQNTCKKSKKIRFLSWMKLR